MGVVRGSASPTDETRCERCFLQRARCVCASIPRVEPSRTRVTVIRHALERFKHSNTGRLVGLAVAGARVVDWGVRGAPSPELAFGPDALLLWPEGEPMPAPPPPGAPVELVVLDGTWPQARRMLQRLPALRGMRRLALPPPAHPLPRLRRTREVPQMSTLEAVAHALSFLEDDTIAAPLRSLLERFAAASIPAHDRRRGQEPMS
jgi:DTW domain-containing protein YfiP